MRHTTSTTARATAALTPKQARSIERLAHQVGKSPQYVLKRIIDLGIKTSDNEIAAGCEWGKLELIDDFDCTARMDKLDFAKIDHLTARYGVPPQREMYFRKWPSNQEDEAEAENVTPFYGRPMATA